MSPFTSALVHRWYRHKPYFFLVPLSYLYSAIIFLRKKCYQWGFLRIHTFSVPVIVVGNITTGGTGKTPFVIALAEYLNQKRYRVGIITRGYHGKPPHLPLRVTADTPWSYCGDEAKLMANVLKKAKIVVDPQRARGVKYLIDQHHCDIILSDDGLQHTAMGRTLEIVLVDSENIDGNGYLLPAGPLRESIARLEQVDFVVSKMRDESSSGLAAGSRKFSQRNDLSGPRLNHGMTKETLRCKQKIWKIDWHPLQWRHLKTGALKPLDYFQGKNVHAVAGIGHPNQFFATLKSLGCEIFPHVKRDHALFKLADLRFSDDIPVAITAKDAVKCDSIAHDNVWVLDMKLDLPTALLVALEEKIGKIPMKEE